MEKRHPIEDVDIYGEQVREVLSKPPNWLTLTGSSLVLVFVLAILTLSYFVKYPDVLAAKLTITSRTPPVNLVARTNGKIQHLFVEDNSEVFSEQPLAIIENAAKLEDINTVKAIIEKLDPDFHIVNNITFPNNLELGGVQTVYSTFVRDYEILKSHTQINAKAKQVHLMSKQLKEYKNLVEKQVSQQQNFENELKILEGDFARSRTLYASGIISMKDLEDKQKEVLRFKRNIDNVLVEKSNTQIAISNIERNVSDATTNDGQTFEQLRVRVFESYQNLTNQIKEWEQNFIIKSPIDGKISYFSFWSTNQNVKQGEDVFAILPKGSSEYVGKALLPIHNTGKLKIGQQAIIKLENYPSTEFGVIIGIVKNISSIPKQSNYSVEIQLQQPLKTNLGKEIEFKDETQGTVEIVTEDLRLIERIFYQIRKIFYRD